MITIDSILDVKNHLHGIKAIVFDMDDTLYGEKQYVRSGYKAIARMIPMVENAEEKLWFLFEKGKQAIDALLLAEEIYSDELKKACLCAYRHQVPEIQLYPGVEDLLDRFRGEGYLLGIITDGRPEGQRAKIHALGLEPMVDCIIVTDELGGPQFRKPNSTAYEKMRSCFGVDYREMLYVGDNPGKDFTACEQLGIRPVYFRNKDGLYSR